MNKSIRHLLATLCIAVVLGLGILPASAAVTVTPASGGAAISADTAATGGSGAWTTLGAITITEGANGDFAVGTGVTLVLKTPDGFEFNTGVTPDVAFTPVRGISDASVAVTDATTMTLTLTVTNNTSLDTLTLGGTTAIEVRPTVGTPLATGRRIHRPSSGGGTATISGITTSANGTTGTSFGPLTEVAGAATGIRVETAANGSGTVVATQNRTSGTTLTVFSIVRDQFSNFITNIAADAWSLPVKTGGVLDGDLAPVAGNKGAIFTARVTGTAVVGATSGALTTTDSGTLTVVPAAASKVVFLTAPQALTAGVVSSLMTVQIQDLNGNPTNGSARTLNLTKSSSAGVFRDAADTTIITSISLPAGTTTASFLYRDTLAGSPLLTAAITGLTSGTQTQTVAAASAALVRVESLANGSGTVVPAQNVTAGNSLTVYAIARDAWTNFVANVAADAWSLSVKTGSVADANLVPNGDSKSAAFTGGLVGTATVRADAGALTPVDSATLTVVAGTATRLYVTLPGENFTPGAGISGTPADRVAGTAFVLTRLTAVDNFTNIATGYTGSKTITYNGPGGNVTYTTSVSFSAGQSTTALNTTLRRAESVSITASSASAPAVTGVPSSTFTVNAGPFARLQLLAPGENAASGTTTGKTGSPSAQTAGSPFDITVNGVDANWNVISAVSDTVGITSSDANAALPADAALVGGTQTFSVTLPTAGSRTLTATDLTDGSKTANTSPTITVTTGAYTKMQLLLPGETAAPGTATGKTGVPNVQTAGTQFTVTVRGVDENWNLVSTATGNISIQSSDANATMPASNNLSGGTRNFNVTLKTASTHTLTATNNTDGTKLRDTSPEFSLNPGAFTKLQLLVPGETAVPGATTGKTGSPEAQVAGTEFAVTVNAVDANWNLITTNDTVRITSSDANASLPADAALADGSQTFNVTLRTVGNRTVTAANVTRPAITANTSSAIAVGTGEFAQLQVLLPGESAAPGTLTGKTGAATARTAGTAFNVNVNAVDANWNLINTNDTVTLTSSDANATLAADAGLVAGTRTLSVTLKTSGTQSVTATDVTNGGITDGSGSALVNPAAANKLLIANQPSDTAEVGVPFVQQPVIHIADAFDNIRSDDTLVVSAARAAGAGALLGTTSVAAVGGVATYTNLAHSLATNITIRFTSGSLTAVTSAPVAVTVGGFARLLALLPGETHAPGTATGKTGTPTATAGSSTPVRVLATDANFNLVDTVTDTVGLTTSDANAELPADFALINGTNTLDLVFKTGGAQTVTVTDFTDGSKTPSSVTVTVSSGPLAKLQLLVPGESAAPGTVEGKTGTPSEQLAGTAFTVTVNGVDANWNIVPGANGSAHTVGLTSTDANATLGSANLSSGVRTFNVTLRTGGTNTITASHLDDPSRTASTSPDINVQVGPFVKLQLLLPGESAAPGTTTGKIGTPSPQVAGVPFNVTVNAVDAAWNLIATNDTVRLTSTDANAVLPADTALVNGTQTLGVTLKTAGNRTITASDLTNPGITANTSPAVVVSPAAYAALQVLLPGESAAPGTLTGKTGTPTTRVAGTGITTLLVNAVDTLWNIVPTNITATITSSDPNAVLPANSALGTDGTKGNFAFTFKTAGLQTITTTDVNDAAKTNTSSVVTVNPGAYTKLQILVPGEAAAPGTAAGKIGTPQPQTSNILFAVTVNSVDANWNVISTNDTIRITSSDTNALLPDTNALAGGSQLFDVALLTEGTNLTVTASNLTRPAITAAVSAAITVNTKLFQTIAFDPLANQAYGDAPSAIEASASSGLPVTFSVLSGPATLTDGTNVTITGAGPVTIRAAQPGDEAYNPASDVDRSFTVTPALLTVTADSTNRTYGASNPAFTAAYSGFTNGDTAAVLSGAPSLTTTATTNTPVGNATITAALGTLSAANYTFAFVDGNVEITQAPLTVTADSQSRTYGAANPALTATFTGLMNGEAPGSLGGSAELSTTADTNSPVGGYTITADVGTLSAPNYSLTFSNGTLTVLPAVLTITANDAMRDQGETNPVFTVTYNGFVNGENAGVLSGALEITTTAEIGSPAGTYPITPTNGTLSAVNYTFNFVSGTLTVPGEFLFSDDFERVGSIAPWVAQAGNWAITNGTLEGGPNANFTYAFAYISNDWGNYSVEGTLSSSLDAFGFGLGGRLNAVTGARYAAWVYPNASPAPIVQLFKFQTWETYGYTNVNESPMANAEISGFTPGDHVLKLVFEGDRIRVLFDGDEVLDVTDAEQTTHATGGITAEMGTVTTPYSINLDNVFVESLQASQTITFDPLANQTYGDAPFALEATASSGLPVTFTVLSGPATLTDGTNVVITGAGVVTMRASQSGNSSYSPAPNVDQAFTVAPAALTLTADSDQEKVYGTADPALTYAITSGALIGDDELTGALARAEGEPIGAYAINQGTLTAGANYDITFVSADFIITPAAFTITAVAQSKAYGEADPALTYQITSGALVGDDELTGALTRNAGETIGAYAINQGSLAASTNYSLSFVSANLSITPAAIAVTADAKSKPYGEADPALSYAITAGALVGDDELTGALTRDAGETIGAYAINQGSLAASTNYNLTYVSANLTITPAAITVTADAQSKEEGADDPALTYQITSGALVGDDEFTGALTRELGETVGTYAIQQGTLTAGTNYNLAFIGANLEITAAPEVPEVVGIVKNGDGSVTVTFSGTPDAEYLVQATATLGATAAWSNVSTNTAGPGGQWTYTDTTAPGQSQRYFRAAKP